MADWMIGDSDDMVSIVTEPTGSGRAKGVHRVGSGIRHTPSPPPLPQVTPGPAAGTALPETLPPPPPPLGAATNLAADFPVLEQPNEQITSKPSQDQPEQKGRSVKKRVTWKVSRLPTTTTGFFNFLTSVWNFTGLQSTDALSF